MYVVEIARIVLTWTGIAGAGVFLLCSMVSHWNGHRDGRFPTTCLVWRLDRGRATTYTILAGGCGMIAHTVFGAAVYPTDAIPGWVFAGAGTLGTLGCVHGYRAARSLTGSVCEHRATIVEAATERDQFGVVLWRTYIAIGDVHADAGMTSGRQAPAVRAPADERGVERPILVRGAVVLGSPIWFHDGKRWVLSEPAEQGGIVELARREVL